MVICNTLSIHSVIMKYKITYNVQLILKLSDSNASQLLAEYDWLKLSRASVVTFFVPRPQAMCKAEALSTIYVTLGCLRLCFQLFKRAFD